MIGILLGDWARNLRTTEWYVRPTERNKREAVKLDEERA